MTLSSVIGNSLTRFPVAWNTALAIADAAARRCQRIDRSAAADGRRRAGFSARVRTVKSRRLVATSEGRANERMSYRPVQNFYDSRAAPVAISTDQDQQAESPSTRRR